MAGSSFRKISPAGTRLRAGDILHAASRVGYDPRVDERVCRLLADRFAVRHSLLTNSGRAALTVILQALAQGDSRNEVILPGYTCFTVAASVRRAGLKVQLVDLKPDSLDYDQADLERKISPRTLAIVAIYPFNLTIDIESLQQVARRNGVYLIEDAAQAIGLTVGGKSAGTIGDVGFFSLSKGKPITTMSGGIIVTNRDNLAVRMAEILDGLPRPGAAKNLKVLVTSLAMKALINPRLYWLVDHIPGVTLGETVYRPSFAMSRMPTASALLLEHLLPRVAPINQDRASNAARWIGLLAGRGGVSVVAGHHTDESLYLRLPLLCRSKAHRERLFEVLKSLGASRMYGEPLEVIDDADLFSPDVQPCPQARSFADRLLTLPTHEYVNDDDMATTIRLLDTVAPQVTVDHE